MKILIIQENGHHDANRNFRECFSLQRAFREHSNIQTTVWGQRHDFYSPTNLPNFDLYDVIINLENYDINQWVPHDKIAQSKAYKILWAIDSHSKGINSYRFIRDLGKYNLMLCSIKHHCDANSVWFPNCYDDLLIQPLRVNKKTRIGFCGNGGTKERMELVDVLRHKYNDFVFDEMVIGQNMVKAINSYGIHFNMNVMDDINYRNFETIGCGIPLLTNYNYQYDELGFEHGKNCLFYKDKNELIKYADTLICMSDHYKQEISNNALELSKKHTYRARVNKLLEFLRSKI